MIKDSFRNYIWPIATLSGGIIGVGFLSLPYVALQVGMGWMLLYFAIFTALVIWIHVMFGEIALQTPDFKRFPGFVGFYFGKPVEAIALVLLNVGSYGALLVYIIVGSQFLATIFGGTILWWAVAYFLAAAFMVLVGIRFISKIEFWALVTLLAALALILFKGFGHVSTMHFAVPAAVTGFRGLFLAFGPLVFSLWGTGLIPETEEMMPGHKERLKKVIIISTLIPAIFYLAFTVIILGITGGQTTEAAFTGARAVLGDGIISLAVLMGVVPTFVSFITQGLILKKSYKYDLGIAEFPAWVFAVFPAMMLFLIGITQFIGIISFIGVFLLPIDAVLIVIMYLRIKRTT